MSTVITSLVIFCITQHHGGTTHRLSEGRQETKTIRVYEIQEFLRCPQVFQARQECIFLSSSTRRECELRCERNVTNLTEQPGLNLTEQPAQKRKTAGVNLLLLCLCVTLTCKTRFEILRSIRACMENQTVWSYSAIRGSSCIQISTKFIIQVITRIAEQNFYFLEHERYKSLKD